MIFLQSQVSPPPWILGTIGMLFLTIALIVFIVIHQRRVIKYQLSMQHMEAEQQKVLLRASIKSQEEERQRIAADLHDDAGPLLATARLYLSENMVHLDKDSQLESILSAKQIIDETIQLIRNISHSLTPPTLKNFGLESAVNDFFQKINNSGSFNAECTFNNYSKRLKVEKELTLFRIIQELINNILRHSNASFIQLIQHNGEENMLLKLSYDGNGLSQEDYIRLSQTGSGLGLKNIQSRLKVVHGDIWFEFEPSKSFYNITIDIPKDIEER